MKMTLDTIGSYGIALLFALLVHALVIGAISINWEDTSVPLQDVTPYYIDASIVSENPFTAKDKRQADKEKSKREKKLQQRRQVEIRLKNDQAAWEKLRDSKPAVEEIAPLVVEAIVEPAVQSDTELNTEQNPEDIRSAFEDAILLALARETNARKAVTDDEKALAYVAQIRRDIVQNWSRPPSARNGMKALLRVHLIPTGEVMDVKVEESSGNDSFDRSAILAVTKADRFVVPSNALRFERDFREFTVLFRPDDLRL
jgi:colicin import membrane protein